MNSALTRAATAVAVAGLLVVGFDYVTYAATGSSLILGHRNSTGATTTVVNRGSGPVLRLRGSSASAPLAVSSGVKVRHLNADRVDGHSAASLSTHTLTFIAGSVGTSYPGTAFWDLPLKPGRYQGSFRVGVQPSDGTAGAPVGVICGLADINSFGDRTFVYTATSGLYAGGGFPVFLSGAETFRVKAGQRPGLLCTTESGTFQFFDTAHASFTRVNSRSLRTATEGVVPSSVAQRALGLR